LIQPRIFCSYKRRGTWFWGWTCR